MILLMANPRAVDEEGGALRWTTVVDSLRGLSFGGAENSIEFHDVSSLTILLGHSEESGSGRVVSNWMVSLLSSWMTVVDSLHGLSFGGTEDGLEFHDMLPSAILLVYLEE